MCIMCLCVKYFSVAPLEQAAYKSSPEEELSVVLHGEQELARRKKSWLVGSG